jgi:PAS domain S-box-containing protein
VGLFVLEISDPLTLQSAKIVEVNSAAAEFLGLTPASLAGKSIRALPKYVRTSILERCRLALQSGDIVDFGKIVRWRRGRRSASQMLRAFSLSPTRIMLTLEDSATRAAAEQAARRSEESFQLLVHGVKDYAIFMLDPHGNILTWNEGAEHLKGYKSDEIIGRNYDIFFTDEDREAGKPEEGLRKAAKTGQAEEEGWLLRKDGWGFWANTVITALHDDQGRLYGFAKITRDMTERKEREESIRIVNEHLESRIQERTAELVKLNEALHSEVRERKSAEEQLRAFAARLERVREEERTHISREIHDALGQMCTALKMDIAWIAKRLPKDKRPLLDKSAAAMRLTGELIKSLRKLSTELRPNALDTLGLVAALEWQAQEFQSHTGIRCKLHVPEKDPVLDKDRSTAIFRIFQETLTNVARHARAHKVETSLVVGDGQIALITRDNGKGFDPAAGRQGSLGLLGMKERAYLLGGEFKIVSAPGKGTTVVVHIPLTAR